VKKGRHRRYEEARELKRSHDGDFDALLDSFTDDDDEELKPEHLAWADEFDGEADDTTPADTTADNEA
jgi:hypothetical protein